MRESNQETNSKSTERKSNGECEEEEDRTGKGSYVEKMMRRKNMERKWRENGEKMGRKWRENGATKIGT